MKYGVQLINNPLIEIKLKTQAVHSTLETVKTVCMYSRAMGESKEGRKEERKDRMKDRSTS
jgi:rRNA processing protein Gar1